MSHKNYINILIILKYLIFKNKLKTIYCLNYYLMLNMNFLEELMLVLAISFKLKIILVKIKMQCVIYFSLLIIFYCV